MQARLPESESKETALWLTVIRNYDNNNDKERDLLGRIFGDCFFTRSLDLQRDVLRCFEGMTIVHHKTLISLEDRFSWIKLLKQTDIDKETIEVLVSRLL